MYLSTAEAAALLGLNTLIVRRQCQNGLITMSTLPGPSGRKRYYIHQKELLRFAKTMKLLPAVIKAIEHYGEEDGVQPGATEASGNRPRRRNAAHGTQAKEGTGFA